MFRLLRKPVVFSLVSLKSSRSLCIDASKQAKIEELIKKSQQMNNISTTQRFVSWLSKNRQQLMNTVMVSLFILLSSSLSSSCLTIITQVFFVFQYSFHIYNVQTVYNDTILKLKEKEEEVNSLRQSFTDNEWITNTEDKIIKNKGGILLNEINARMKSLEPDTPLDVVTKFQQNDSKINNNEKKGDMI